jgi:hypothetical protein
MSIESSNERPGVDAGWRVLFAFQRFWPHAAQGERYAAMATSRSLPKLLLTSSFLLFFACGCVVTSNMVNFWPLRYTPSCDVQPVLAIKMPNYIESLAGCPRDETLTLDGRNKEGGKWPDDIKQFFYFSSGQGEFGHDVRYEFDVFFSEASAVEFYESEKRWRSKYDRVFKEVSGEAGTACIYYTRQERADPEGGSVPMGIYHARVSFRIRNAYICITTNERTSKSDKLALAVRDLAQMLTDALSNTNRLSQSNSQRNRGGRGRGYASLLFGRLWPGVAAL